MLATPHPKELVQNPGYGPGNMKNIRQVPVLCYHNISSGPGRENQMHISQQQLNEQLKGLYDSGYHSILPGQLVAYYGGGPLPAKPFIVSFDDAHVEHFTIAAPLLERYGFRGVFFVPTQFLDKRGYLSSAQVKQLAGRGHVIGDHTRSHPNLTKPPFTDWAGEIDRPKKILETITGNTIDCFGYPFGEWNENAVNQLQNRGFTCAFQLTGKMSATQPLLTIRRLMVNGSWTPNELQGYLRNIFH